MSKVKYWKKSSVVETQLWGTSIKVHFQKKHLLLSDWLKHTPPDILRKNLRLDANSLAKLPKAGPLYIFDGETPKNTLEQDRVEVGLRAPLPKMTFYLQSEHDGGYL